MARIYFAAEDLSRIRLTTTLGPLAESVFALDLLARPSSVVYQDWRHRVFAAGRSGTATTSLLRQRFRPIPDLLWLLRRPSGVDDERLRATGLTRTAVASAVQDFCRIAVVPYWGRARRYLESERDAHGRMLVTGGIERLLGMVHAGARWSAPMLELPLERSGDVYLDGRGLALAPSLFLPPRCCVLVDTDLPGEPPVLVFPVPPDRRAALMLWHGVEEGDQTLEALLGRTRAGLLRVLTDSHTNGELAERLSISPAGVSQHTAVLRDAGLITSRRDRKTVLHTLTRLGTAVVLGLHLDGDAASRPASLPQSEIVHR
ncbi:ArsR/SmtB family transcription factor [Micromonospora sp. DT201]|uniref:ArsR/SmtB family transcription factor n=1 Tax=Micromonospora sp. DT201 TaxID=3393442 RepID=UPI003CF4B505